MNAADMLALLRDYLNEATASFWTDVNLVRRLNMSQRKVERMVAMSPGDWLTKSASVTPSSSVITLPSDCAKPIYLEETSDGEPLSWLPSVAYRRVSRAVGTTLDQAGAQEAYPLRATIEVNRDDYSTACTLWYQIRVPNLHTGVAGASSGASALQFASDRNLVYLDDYYNDVTVEVIDDTSGVVDIRSEITDFAASTGIATITGTAASGDTYGTISLLPEETHHLIVLDAAVNALSKPSAQFDETAYRHIRDWMRDEKKDVENWLQERIVDPGVGTLIGDPL